MRSRPELLEASRYANRPRDFDDLVRILDLELRLITPTDAEGKDESGRIKDEQGKTSDTRAGQPRASHRSDSSFILHPSSFILSLLPARARLSGPLPAGMVDSQTAPDASRKGRTSAGRTGLALELQAREPPSSVCPGMGQYPAPDQEAELVRTAKQDDEAGRATARRTDDGIDRARFLDHLGRDRGLWQPAGRGPCGVAPYGRHHRRPGGHQPARRLPAVGRPSSPADAPRFGRVDPRSPARQPRPAAGRFLAGRLPGKAAARRRAGRTARALRGPGALSIPADPDALDGARVGEAG